MPKFLKILDFWPSELFSNLNREAASVLPTRSAKWRSVTRCEVKQQGQRVASHVKMAAADLVTSRTRVYHSRLHPRLWA